MLRQRRDFRAWSTPRVHNFERNGDMRLRPPIMIAHSPLDMLLPALQDRYALFRLWKSDEVDQRFLEEARVLVVAGGVGLDLSLIERMPRIGLIACASAGYDGVDLDEVRQRGLQVSHAQGVNDEDVADHALGCLIMWRRSLLAGDALIRSGYWEDNSSLRNRSVRGLKLGIVGLGRVGSILASRASILGMDVRWWGPENKFASWTRMPSLTALAADRDALVITARADAANCRLVSAEIIDALGPGGYLINVARGSLVDEEAVIAALKSRKLGGAALDVFEKEPTDPARWLGVPNLVMTPHIAGKTSDAINRLSDQLAGNIDAFLAGRPLLTPIE